MPNLRVARSLLARSMGLIGKTLRSDLSLLIPRCSSVHTFFMRTPIDIVFLDAAGVILGIVDRAPRWRFYSGPARTRAVLELPPGRAQQYALRRGDVIAAAIEPPGRKKATSADVASIE